MNKVKRATIKYYLFAILGLIMFVASLVFNLIDSFWSGMGVAFIAISATRIVQLYRYKNDDSYAEKVNIENSDERNRFLAEKARSISFYYYIMIVAILTIILRLLNYSEISSIIAYTICILVVIYLLSYLWVKHKY